MGHSRSKRKKITGDQPEERKKKLFAGTSKAHQLTKSRVRETGGNSEEPCRTLMGGSVGRADVISM